MPTLIRFSPSGPSSSEGAAQTSDDIENTSSAPGATFTDALDAIDADIEELEAVTVADDFLGGLDSATSLSVIGAFGDTGWSFASSAGTGSISRPTDQEYMGAYAITAPASTISGFTYSPNITQQNVTLPTSLFDFVEFLVCPNIADAAAGGSFRAGLGQDADASNFGTNALFVEVARATSDNWRFVTRVASVNTVVTSTIPFAAHTLTRVRMRRDLSTGTWTASINGVDIASFLTGQVSGSRMIAGIQVESGAGSAQSMSIDRFSLDTRATLFV